MLPKRCPRCGATQQWVLWQSCFCGYDFGPPGPAQPPASEFLERWARPRFITARFATAVTFELAAIPVALWAEPFFGFLLAMAGTSIAPAVVQLKPVRTQAIEAVCIVGGLVLVLVGIALFEPFLDVPSSWRRPIYIAMTIALALHNLWSFPKRRRELLADLAQRR
jgi:hypothetical protein